MTSPAMPGPPTAQGGPYVPPPRSGPSNKGYLIGGIIAGIGIVAGVVLIVVGVVAFASINPSDFPRTRANHSLKIDFEHSGGYVAYYESSAVGNAIDSEVEVPSFSLTVTDSDGNRVSTGSYSGNLTYSRDGHHGIAAKTFHIDNPGVYTFKVGSLPNSDARVAFGKSTAGATVGGVVLILAGIFGGGLLVLIGIIVLLVTFFRRRGHANRVAAAGAGYGYGAPPAGYPAPPGQAPAAPQAPWGPGAAAPPTSPPSAPGWGAPQPPAAPPPGPPPAPGGPTDPNTPPPLPPPGAPGA